MTFDTRVSILVDLLTTTNYVPEWENFRKANDLGLPLALAHRLGMCTLSESGKAQVDKTYALLLEVLNVSGEFTNINQLFEAAIANGADTATDTATDTAANREV